MAAKVFYHLSTKASGSNFMDMQDGGSAPSTATTGTGWIVAKTAATAYSLMYATTKRATATFGGTALPNANPDSTNGDCFRTPTALTGTFANANWSLKLSVIAVDRGGSQDGNIRVRVYKSANANGSSPTELTGSTQTGGTVTNLATSAAQSTDVTWSPGSSIILSNEYLFFQYAWTITGAGGFTNCDVLLIIGTNSSITTSDFAGVDPLTQTKTDDLNAWGESQRLGLGMSVIGDQITLTEDSRVNLLHRLAIPGDALSQSDEAGALLGIAVEKIDSLNLSDELSLKENYLVDTGETLALSDSLGIFAAWFADIGDSLSFADDLLVILNTQLSESDQLALSDAITTELSEPNLLKILADSFTITDGLALILSHFLSTDDQLALSDEIGVYSDSPDKTQDLSDSLSLNDSVGLNLNQFLELNDAINLSDAVNEYLDVANVFSTDTVDSMSFSDGINIVVGMRISKNETLVPRKLIIRRDKVWT